jgi:hypothetical protein
MIALPKFLCVKNFWFYVNWIFRKSGMMCLRKVSKSEKKSFAVRWRLEPKMLRCCKQRGELIEPEKQLCTTLTLLLRRIYQSRNWWLTDCFWSCWLEKMQFVENIVRERPYNEFRRRAFSTTLFSQLTSRNAYGLCMILEQVKFEKSHWLFTTYELIKKLVPYTNSSCRPCSEKTIRRSIGEN